MLAYIGALGQVVTSTWGASFCIARQVYTAVVRLVMTYRAFAWFTPADSQTRAGQLRGPVKKLQVLQNKCLRAVSGAFRATPIENLEVETFVSPLDLHLCGLVAGTRRRLASSQSAKEIESASRAIRNRLQGRRRKTPRPTPGQAKGHWATNWLEAGGQPATRERGSEVQVAVLRSWKARKRARRRPPRLDRIDSEPSASIL